jgi:uncharacterized membrane protein
LPKTPRAQSVDALRGVAMILMALDHIREFIHADASRFQPDDLTRATALLFFTRWVTHFCAPIFFFTAGVGAYLRWRSTDKTQLAAFLWKRGLWLILLELTVLRLIMNFSLFRGLVLLSILWALGWSMVALSFLIRLPIRVLAVLSVMIIALHNLTDSFQPAGTVVSAVWKFLHQPGLVPIGSLSALVAYPVVPWIFVMSAGYCAGHILTLEPATRQRLFLILGASVTVAFILLRSLNVYGDPQPRIPGVWLSFLRCTKYPPSLDFLLMTLGPALLFLARFDSFVFSVRNPLMVFGRTPLFYFLLHLLVIHTVAVVLAWTRYGTASFLSGPMRGLGGEFPADYGYSLTIVYLISFSVVLLMYPVCRWFADVKRRRSVWWLGYL